MDGRARENSEILTQRQLPFKKEMEEGELTVSDAFWTCACCASINTLSTESDGNIYPCSPFTEPQFALGHILEINSLSDCISYDNDNFVASCIEKYEPGNCQECKNCDVSYFCWPCLHERGGS